MEILEWKNILSKMENSPNKLNDELEMAEERISEDEDRPTEFIHS